MKKASSSRRPGPLEPIDSVLDKLFHEGKLARSLQVAQLENCWPELVGDDAAPHCSPEKISRGKLYIHVDSSVWCQHLDLFKEDVLQKMNHRFRHLQVTKIVCKTASS